MINGKYETLMLIIILILLACSYCSYIKLMFQKEIC